MPDKTDKSPTPKEALIIQFERLPLNSDLKLMVQMGVSRMTDEQALQMTKDLKEALESALTVRRIIEDVTNWRNWSETQ